LDRRETTIARGPSASVGDRRDSPIPCARGDRSGAAGRLARAGITLREARPSRVAHRGWHRSHGVLARAISHAPPDGPSSRMGRAYLHVPLAAPVGSAVDPDADRRRRLRVVDGEASDSPTCFGSLADESPAGHGGGHPPRYGSGAAARDVLV